MGLIYQSSYLKSKIDFILKDSFIIIICYVIFPIHSSFTMEIALLLYVFNLTEIFRFRSFIIQMKFPLL